MFALKLAFKNIISRKSSISIILFISFSIAMMLLANSIFDGTGNGIQSSFISSFTGDILIRPKVDYPLSLFGDETPTTGEFSDIPNIPDFEKIKSYVDSYSEIRKTVPQITRPVMLNFPGGHSTTILFGVDLENYLDAMSGIKLVDSMLSSHLNDGNCILMSKNFINFVNDDSHVDLKMGDTIQIVSKTPMSFNVRSAKLCAIYEYETENPVLDRICIVDSRLLLDLIGKSAANESDTEEIDDNYKNLLDSDFDDLDSLFGDFSDSEELSPFEKNEETAKEPDSIVAAETEQKTDDSEAYWHFLICTLNKDSQKKTNYLILKMNKYFKDNNLSVEAVNWRTAAGLSAQYLYWIRLVFNIGIFIILGTGFIVVNSALTISSMDRLRETGTMRALGASKGFVGLQYLFETFILTFSAGIVGCVIGAILVELMNIAPITFTNTYLMQLFGGSKIVTSVSFGNICHCFYLVLALTVLGWLSPVRVAFKATPVKAMQGGS